MMDIYLEKKNVIFLELKIKKKGNKKYVKQELSIYIADFSVCTRNPEVSFRKKKVAFNQIKHFAQFSELNINETLGKTVIRVNYRN